MAAGYQELFLEKGSDFSTSITLDNADGTAFSLANTQVKSSIRKSYYSANTTADFVTIIPDVTQGIIFLTLPHTTTANITAGRYVYDVLIKDTSANTVSRVLEGIVNVLPQVTVF